MFCLTIIYYNIYVYECIVFKSEIVPTRVFHKRSKRWFKLIHDAKKSHIWNQGNLVIIEKFSFHFTNITTHGSRALLANDCGAVCKLSSFLNSYTYI